MRIIVIIMEPSKDEIEIFCGSSAEFGVILDEVAFDLSAEARENLKTYIEKNWDKFAVPIFESKGGQFLQLRWEDGENH